MSLNKKGTGRIKNDLLPVLEEDKFTLSSGKSSFSSHDSVSSDSSSDSDSKSSTKSPKSPQMRGWSPMKHLELTKPAIFKKANKSKKT